MRIRSFIIAYALVLAILLFADRRPGSTQQDRYSHVVDLTDPAQANLGPLLGRRDIADAKRLVAIEVGLFDKTISQRDRVAERRT